jgi:hypothetical protein
MRTVLCVVVVFLLGYIASKKFPNIIPLPAALS